MSDDKQAEEATTEVGPLSFETGWFDGGLPSDDIRWRLVDMAERGEDMLQYNPPGLKERIWAKFMTLAQIVRPSRN